MPTYRKITVFEVGGTGHLFPGDPIPDLNLQSFVEEGINPAYFSYTLITGYPNSAWPMNVSVAAGVAQLLAAINRTPGKFVFVGLSQGAHIVCETWRQLVAINSPRLADLLHVYSMGSPVRQTGRSFPGGTPVGGHGIAPASVRMTNTPNFIWEFANPGDPITATGDDVAGVRATSLYEVLYQSFSGTVSELTSSLKEVTSVLSGLAGPHQVYTSGTWVPPGASLPATTIVLNHLNTVIGPQYATAVAEAPIARNYGLVTTGGTAKPARATVARWNDRRNRHTLYSICGTQQDGWGLFNAPTTVAAAAETLAMYRLFTGNNALTLPADGQPIPDNLATPDAVTGRRVNPDLFNWVPVSYPAVAPGSRATLENDWQPQNLSIADSVKVGVDELTAIIQATPGTFAITAMSQGALVASQALRAMQPGGALASRAGDCIGAAIFGNPARRAGVSFPGGTAPSGAGICALSPTIGLGATVLPSWWWEFCTVGDFFSDSPTNTVAGPTINAIMTALFNFKGSQDLSFTVINGLVSAFMSGSVPLVTAALRDALWTLFAPKAPGVMTTILTWLTQQVGTPSVVNGQLTFSGGLYPTGNPHVKYHISKPPTRPTGIAGLNANSTYVDCAVAYLNARGAAIAPR